MTCEILFSWKKKTNKKQKNKKNKKKKNKTKENINLSSAKRVIRIHHPAYAKSGQGLLCPLVESSNTYIIYCVRPIYSNTLTHCHTCTKLCARIVNSLFMCLNPA